MPEMTFFYWQDTQKQRIGLARQSGLQFIPIAVRHSGATGSQFRGPKQPMRHTPEQIFSERAPIPPYNMLTCDVASSVMRFYGFLSPVIFFYASQVAFSMPGEIPNTRIPPLAIVLEGTVDASSSPRRQGGAKVIIIIIAVFSNPLVHPCFSLFLSQTRPQLHSRNAQTDTLNKLFRRKGHTAVNLRLLRISGHNPPPRAKAFPRQL